MERKGIVCLYRAGKEEYKPNRGGEISAVRRAGFTLVEMVVVMTLLTIVIALSLSLFIGSLKAQDMSYSEYDFQSKLRQMSDVIDKTINSASALFTIPKESFDRHSKNGTLSKKWDYYGLSEDGKEFVSYVYDPVSDTHIRKVLVSGENITFRFRFYKPHDETTGQDLGEKFVGYRIEVLKDGQPTGYEIDTYIEAKNSQQVVHRGTESLPASAIAIRNRTKVEERKTITFVHMVFDVSGSMEQPLGGIFLSAESRISLLKKAAKELVGSYAKEDGVELLFYPFSRTANIKGGVYDPYHSNSTVVPDPADVDVPGNPSTYTGHPIFTKNHAILNHATKYISEPVTDFAKPKLTEIRSLDTAIAFIDGLHTGHTTNVTDSLRRVYHQIRHINNVYIPTFYPGISASHYLVILVDGEPNAAILLQKTENDGNYALFRNHFLTGNPPQVKFYEGNGSYWPYVIEVGSTSKKRRKNSDGYFYRDSGSYTYGIYPTYKDDISSSITNPVSLVEKTISHYGEQLSHAVEKTYVIGFSGYENDLIGVDYIARACGISDDKFDRQVVKFDKDRDLDLTNVFLNIKKQIMEDIWLVEGPGL